MRRVVAILVLLSLGACAMHVPDGPPHWQAGYADGCRSGQSAAGNVYQRFVKQHDRMADPDYASGWQDGFNVCKGQYESSTRIFR